MTTDLSNWKSPRSLEEWWNSETQKHLRRPYSAASVIRLRDMFPENTLGNAMALKLRKAFTAHHSAGTACMTYAVPDVVSLQRMAEAGYECAYVSGSHVAKSSITDPGVDLADYPYDSVPNEVQRLNRAQLLQARMADFHKPGNGERLLLPIIADADSGHGQTTAIMKLVKLFVQSGVAGIHLDDLLSGTKRFDGKDGEGWIITPTCEAIRRLIAARYQLDLMGSEMMLIYRTVGASSTRITDAIDYRDRPYILGASMEQAQDYASLTDSPSRASWKASAKLMTLDEAFQSAHRELYPEFEAKTAKMNISSALRVAAKLAPSFYWSGDAARSLAGFYLFRGCPESAAERCIAASHVIDVSWMNMTLHNEEKAIKFSELMQRELPGRWTGYNMTGTFPADGSRDEEARKLPALFDRLKYTWTFMPGAGITSWTYAGEKLARTVKEKGILGYIQEFSRPAELSPQDSPEVWNKTMGQLSDAASEAIGDGY